MNIKLKELYVVLIVIFMFSCKTSKTMSSNSNLNSNISAKQLIKNNTKNRVNFNTLTAKIKAEYLKKETSKSVTISLRMEKDKTIWMSASFSIVKALITPTKVSYYNKLDHSFFEGDFKILSDFVGTELDFNKIQNILLGEALYDLKKEDYQVSINENSYVLQPKNPHALFEIFYLLNPSHFKIDSQQFTQPQESRHLQIDYKNYQEIDNQVLPQNIQIIALENLEETIINLEYKSLLLNQDIRFPYRIPSGYKQIEMK